MFKVVNPDVWMNNIDLNNNMQSGIYFLSISIINGPFEDGAIWGPMIYIARTNQDTRRQIIFHSSKGIWYRAYQQSTGWGDWTQI